MKLSSIGGDCTFLLLAEKPAILYRPADLEPRNHRSLVPGGLRINYFRIVERQVSNKSSEVLARDS
jgi:hypothetical protein